jgi:hypothetical protein
METTTIHSSRLTSTMDPNITDASQYVSCLGSVIAKLDLKSIDRIAERLVRSLLPG